MVSISVVGVSALNGLNLVSSKPGLVCRIKVDNSDNLISSGQLRNLETSFKLLDEMILPADSRLKLRTPGNPDAEAVIYYYCVYAIQIQKAAGCPVSVFRYNELKDGMHWDIFFEYEFEAPGRNAAAFANDLIKHVFANRAEDLNHGDLAAAIAKGVANFKAQYAAVTPKLEARSILLAAEKRQIPWRQIPGALQFAQYGYGKHQKILLQTIMNMESHISVKITDDKAVTSTMLAEVGLPVARHARVHSADQAVKFAKYVGYPVVVKPLVGMQGTGVTPNIKDAHELVSAYDRACELHSVVLVEKHTVGDDYRLLVFGGKFVGAIKRSVTVINGDGKRCITEIIDEVNRQPWRNRFFGDPKYQVRKIPIVEECLKQQGYDWESVPVSGAKIRLHFVPNISQGGTVETILDGIHPENIKMAERAAKTVGLKIAGVDYLTEDISKPYWESGGTICEVNAKPAYDLMFDVEVKYRNELGRLAFELSCPPKENMTLPVVIFIGKEQTLSAQISEWLSGQGLTVGYHSANKATVGGAPLIQSNGRQPSISSVLWNGAVDVVLLQESTKRIQRNGLEYSLCSHVVVASMPMLAGRQVPKILNLILQTVTHKVLVNKDNQDLMDWADTVSDEKIKTVSANDLQEKLMRELQLSFPEDIKTPELA